jgi:small conductance mechanosensitive channel
MNLPDLPRNSRLRNSPFRTGLLACLLLAGGALASLPVQAKAPSPERAMAPATPPELPIQVQPGAEAAATPNAARVAAEVRAGTRQDSDVATAVAALLMRQPGLSGVTVQVQAGIVALGGKVPEEADRARATTLAKSVRGVTDVVSVVQLDANLHTRLDSALDQVKDKLVRIVAAVPLLAVAILIVALAWWIGRVVSRRPARWLRERSRNPYMDGLVRRILQTIVLLLGVLLALNLLGATSLVGAVLGSAGVIGLAFGFAFKDVAENYISGVLLSLRRPFAPGDRLVIDRYEGKVVALTSRTTLLMTLDGNHLSLPNALVFKSVVLNYSVNPKRRFEVLLPIDPSQSIRRAQELALQALAKVGGVLADPAPSWSADGYNAKGIDLRFYGWIDQRDSDLTKVRSEALRAIKGAFGHNGIQGPETVRYLAPEAPAAAATRAVGDDSDACGDTSVNRDIDAQLAAAQQATNERNLLDTNATPNDGDSAARTA